MTAPPCLPVAPVMSRDRDMLFFPSGGRVVVFDEIAMAVYTPLYIRSIRFFSSFFKIN